MTEKFLEQRLKDRPAVARGVEAEEPRREVAALMRRMRKAAGLTQGQLADRAGWAQTFVSRLERFTGAMPEPGTVARFAEACGFTLTTVHRATRRTPEGVQTMEAAF